MADASIVTKNKQFRKMEVMENIYLEIPMEYDGLEPIGVGAFGLVCSAKNKQGEAVAIKRIIEPFKNRAFCRRAYREVKLLKHLQHDNVIALKDVFISPNQDLYLVTELLGADLHQVIQSQRLELSHIQYFVYQMLRALKYVHSAGVVHRDLKPSNILVNENCDLKLCDFGLARIADLEMTGYVSTRYYRAPEIMLSWRQYGQHVDIWSVGCILAELFLGRPLLPGKGHIHQFQLITELLGSPPDEILTRCNANTLAFVKNFEPRPKIPFSTLFNNSLIHPTAIDLMEKMLTYDPNTRITAADALEHPFFEAYHVLEDEPIANNPFDWSFNDQDFEIHEWKEMISHEINTFVPPEPSANQNAISS